MASEDGSKKVSFIFLLIIILVVGGAASGISYFYSQQLSQGKIQEAQTQIRNLQAEEGDLTLEIARLNRELEKKPQTVVTKELDCLLCHDLEQHKEFHVPETIMKLDEAHGLRRRVCIDCHGPNGPPWSSDVQMTDLELINFDSRAGRNGKFILSNQVVHAIHKRKLDAGILSCEFCHVPAGSTDFVIPQAKTELGRVLYCQNEGCHDNEGGNYIAIHVELRPFKCTTCHTGDLVVVHQGGTGVLGQFTLVNRTVVHVSH
jgi:hypothetical protein